ncbi:MAG: HU family DNA-binding protein [Candidatus Colwellbacteria bacterium]|nr:HU family DNA-binding protein [Candidatus Colwellbacteria bacterium]
MAQAQPIEITSLAKRGLLDEKRFFRLLSENNNYVDPQTIRHFYRGLVTLIKKELYENGGVRLPEIGDMALVKKKAHLGWAGSVRKIMPESKTLIFYPKEALRKHFKSSDVTVVPKYISRTALDEFRVEE